MHAENHFPSDSLIESSIRDGPYIHYLVIIHTMCKNIIIICTILSCDMLDYGLIIKIALIATC